MKEKNTLRTDTENTPEKEGASSRHLDKKYIKSYRKWRQDNKGKYGFYYRDAGNEFSYESGRGFIKDIPEYAEISALSRVNTTICIILTVYMLFKAFADYLLPLILANNMGIYIGINYNTKIFYGNEEAIIAYLYAVKIIGRLVPLILLSLVTKMPFSIMFPVKISNKPLFALSVPAALLAASVCSALMYPFKSVLSLMHVNTEVGLMATDNVAFHLLSMLLTIVISPVLSELIVHGGFFQLLRQFGDGYALVISGLILAFNMEDIRVFPFYFVIGMAAGYFTLRTGSILTAIVMRITVMFYAYVQSYFASIPDPETSSFLILLFMTACMSVGVVFLVYHMTKSNYKINLPLKGTYLTSYEKMMEFLTNPAVIIWFGTGVCIMAISTPVAV